MKERRSIANIGKGPSFEDVSKELTTLTRPYADPLELQDPLDERLNRKKFTETHKQRGLYIRADLDEILTNKSKEGGHGMKTAIINEALERLFRDKGWLDDE